MEVAAVVATLAAIPMAAAAHTLDHQLIAANDDCADLLRLSADDIAGRPIRHFIPEPDRPSALLTARALTRPGPRAPRPVSSLRRLITGDGEELTCWLHVGVAVIGGFECFVACIDLVNPVLSDAHRWRHRAEHDELTGLRRRGSLLAQVAQWVDAGSLVAFAFLDVDNFKLINDTHGHAAGDHVLSTLARRLEQHAPAGCLVGRLSGDEFVLAQVVAGLPGRAAGAADAAAEVLRMVGRRGVAEPIAWGDHLLAISISVGIAVNEPGEDATTLLARADNAMYGEKSRITRDAPAPG